MLYELRMAADTSGGQIRPAKAPRDGTDASPLASWWGGNPLESAPSEAVARAASGPAAMWSGSMASWDDDPDGLSAPDPRTWGGAGWQRFESLCGELEAHAAGSVLFRTHAAHVLSDLPSCSRFLREWWGRPTAGGGGLSLLLDPAAMLTGTMINSAPDHLERILSGLAAREGVGAVMLTNLAEGPGPRGALQASPVHRGILDVRVLVEIAQRHVPRQMPLIVLGDEVEAQRSALSALLADRPVSS